jgi:hypothetical protein
LFGSGSESGETCEARARKGASKTMQESRGRLRSLVSVFIFDIFVSSFLAVYPFLAL